MKMITSLTVVVASVVALSSAAHAASLTEVLATNPNFSQLEAAVKAAGLEQAVKDLKDATVFAPTNQAFDYLSVGQTRNLFSHPDKLKKLLLNHIIAQPLTEKQLIGQVYYKTLAGYNVIGLSLLEGGTSRMYSSKIATNCQGTKKLRMAEIVGSAEITKPDVMLDNGVIVHVLDQVSREPVPGSGSDVGFPIQQPQFVGLACGLLN